MKAYKFKINKGYLGDFETEYWTEEDWKRHELCVERLKESGEYGKEEEITIYLKPNSLFDNSFPIIENSLETSRFIFLNDEDWLQE